MPGADSRCTASGNSSLSSFIRVAMPQDDPDTPSINLIIPSGPTGFEPIDSLQKLFSQYHSCLPDTTATGIHNINQPFKIFPNPAGKALIISGTLPAGALIELFDTTGRKALTEKITSPTINIARLPRSTYLCRISAGNKILYNTMVTLE